MRVVLMALVFALFSLNADAQASLKAQRTPQAPRIDGRLDESVWSSADVVRSFTQYEPREGEPATERTEVRVLYDDSSLYVGARLFDSEPDKIARRISRRDDDADADRFNFYVDPMHDHVTGAVFQVSAGGGQADWIISNDTSEEVSWDAVWESAVTIDREGWNVEMRIPLSQLRFRDSPTQTWGFNIERVIYRKGEIVWFELVPKKENGLASRMAHLTGLDGVKPRRTFELVPHVVARGEFTETQPSGDPFNDGSRYKADGGFDMKLSLRPNVILNATVNPDFGQVEIDPAVVNLGAFETFYPEKRPFFIEGAQIFENFGNLGANNRPGYNREEPNIFHSRRIGRSPQAEAFGDFVDTPEGTTILGAVKLTGKTRNEWSFGILDAVTDREFARISNAGQNSRVEVEPKTNYFAGRLLKEFGAGRAGLGGLFTGVNRELRDPGLRALLPGRAYVAGADGYVFLDEGRQWVVHGRAAFSRVDGSEQAIERLQLEPQRYFQRPDSGHLSFDPNRTSLRGWNGNINLNRNEGAWTFNTAVWGVSPDFESGDLGFHFNGDVWGTHGTFTWKQIQQDGFSRDRDITFAKFYVWDYGREKLVDGVTTSGNVVFRNYWTLSGTFSWFRAGQDNRLTRGGPPTLQVPNGSATMSLKTDYHRKVVLQLNGTRDWNEAGGGSGSGGFSVEWKPVPGFNVSSGPTYTHSVNVAQYIETLDDPAAVATFGKRYVFGRLQQQQVSMDTRVNVLFTPKVSLQLYVQPLVAVGDYVDIRSLAGPRSFEFETFSGMSFDPNFNFKSLRVNAIFRWEWSLGSTLYIAWTQQREDLRDPGIFRPGPDLGRLFNAPADNVLLIKFTRWLNL